MIDERYNAAENAESAIYGKEAPVNAPAYKPKVTEETVIKAISKLREYQSGKNLLDERLQQNEEWWKLKTQGYQIHGDKKEYKRSSAWLWNTVVSKHADAMDAFPEANIRPRAPDDVEEAERLKNVIPAMLEQNDFEKTFGDCMWYKLKMGTCVYGVVWDASKHGGLGDIAIRRVNLLNLFWEPGVTDIQASENVFYVTRENNTVLERKYPQLKGELRSNDIKPREYKNEDGADGESKTSVIDWYYHSYNQNGQPILQYCKFCGTTVLFASENEVDENGMPKYPDGWYAHGMYPFVFDVLYPIEESICGYGLIDVHKGTQEQIDVLDQSICKSASVQSKMRYFVRSDSGLNETEFADTTKDFVHFTGVLDDTAFRQITYSPMSPAVIEVYRDKIQEIKEVSGNRDVANGGTTSGVTAASGIAAMQEASGKLSRDSNKTTYDAFKRLINMCIELMRQFYDIPRYFRITGEGGEDEYVKYDNSNLKPQYQGKSFGDDMGFRTPVFDIKVSAQKATPYTKMAQNELALQFNNAGFFIPDNAQTALACLSMMDFDGKDEVKKTIEENATFIKRQQALLNIALSLAKTYAPDALFEIGNIMGFDTNNAPYGNTGAVGGMPRGNADMSSAGEGKQMNDARNRAQEATQVR